MSVHAGPNTTEDGLVFALDMTNTQKSWRGAPATNLLTDSEIFSNWSAGGTITLEYGSTTSPTGALTATKITNSVASNIYKSYAITISTVVCFSIHVKKFSSSTITVESNTAAVGSMTFNFDTGAITSSGAYTSPVVSPLENGWYRISSVITASSTGNLNIYLYGNSYGTAGISYIWGAQLELGTFPTPYIPTTTATASRSNTQAILDLTNRNIITANSLTYNSDGSFRFNGTTDYVTAPVSCDKTYYSINWWMRPTAVTNYNQTFGFNTGNVQTWGAFLFHTTSAGAVYVGTRGEDINRMTPTELPAGTLVTNTWHNFCWTFDNGTAKFYKNAVLLATKVLPISGNQFTSFTLGTTSTTTINGSISNISIYSNRVLLQNEISQNFNALRGRYGI